MTLLHSRSFSLYLIFVLSTFLYACNLSQSQDKKHCQKPENFSEANLVGIWEAGWARRNDTIIISSDGLYKQKLQVEEDEFKYESDWQRWWINYQNGIPYLHLEGMRMCVYWSGVECDQVGGGDFWWYDFCQEKSVKIPNEGVLIVLGFPEEIAKMQIGFNLFAFQVHTEETTVYQLRKP